MSDQSDLGPVTGPMRARLRDYQSGLWYRYEKSDEMVVAHTPDEVMPAIARVEKLCAGGQVAAGFVTYEAAPGFDSHLPTKPRGELPLVCFGVYEGREPCSAPSFSGSQAHESWQGPQSFADYEQAIDKLRAQIAAGNVYQVNYTDRKFSDNQNMQALFARIAGNALFGGLFETERFTIVSASPELFFTLRGDKLACKPMKGTASRGLSEAEDVEHAQWLATSSKNRAENLMITDMVRNDLGRVADTGSVQVPALFEVEPYPTVWQMTSKVQATTNASLAEIFAALFPGASITGAPKRASMALIEQMESEPREIYTGAIGTVGPGRDATFSIAIRTAWKNNITGRTSYGVGGGIVWDSTAKEEYEELAIKTRILNPDAMPRQLLETMRLQPHGRVFMLDQHLQRLARSAIYFGFVFDEQKVRESIDEYVAKETGPSASSGSGDVDDASPDNRLRLMLNMDGTVQVTHHALATNPPIQRIALANTTVRAQDILLYHKTTSRRLYEDAAAQVPEGVEAILQNDDGFITESVIANVVFQIDGELFTPPISDGLLPGILRAKLIAAGDVSERSLAVNEMRHVQQWYLVSALRGWREARVSR